MSISSQGKKPEKINRQWLISIIIESETESISESRKEKSQLEIKINIEKFITIVEENTSKSFKTLVEENPSAKKIKTEDLKKLQKQILSTKLNKQDAYAVLGVLSNWIAAGNEAGFWDLCPPPLPVFIKAPVSPFGKDPHVSG